MEEKGFKRKLTAILSADVIGFSRLRRADEEATVRDLAAYRVLIAKIIQQHHGRVVDSPGDNILAEFASVVDAVKGAIKIQTEIKNSNSNTHESRRMELRIGINLGDVIEEEARIYRDGVNIAARVEGLAVAGGIAISGTVYDHIKDKISLGYNTFLNGWAHYLRETPDNFVMAIQYFKKALELDPNYGRAYAALALTYLQSWKRLWHFRVGLSHWHDARFEAEKFLKKAMQNLTPLALQVNTSEFLHLKRYEEAIAEAEHAIVMDPNDADNCLALASVLSLAKDLRRRFHW